jgi:hypothetical protein
MKKITNKTLTSSNKTLKLKNNKKKQKITNKFSQVYFENKS